MKSFTISKHTKGFTLVEVMIAMVISLILLLGVMQIFNSNKRSQRVSSGLARIQENARFAIKKISADMRRAGYVGCSSDAPTNHLDTSNAAYDPDLFDFSKGTSGYEFTNGVNGTGPTNSATQPGKTYSITTLAPAPAGDSTNWQNNTSEGIPSTLAGLVVPGNDVVLMKWTGDDLFNIELQNSVNAKSTSIQTKTAHGIENGTILVISDCQGGDVFQQVSNGGSKSLTAAKASGAISPGNDNSTDWGGNYSTGANLSVFISRVYYIGRGTSGEPSLYSMTYQQGTGAGMQLIEEIAEGIENMQILYGLKATDALDDFLPVKYVTAQQVTDHGRVVSLKVGLIARSPSPAKNAVSSRNLTLLGTTITTPSDANLRFAFTSTVKLRNKGAK